MCWDIVSVVVLYGLILIDCKLCKSIPLPENPKAPEHVMGMFAYYSK